MLGFGVEGEKFESLTSIAKDCIFVGNIFELKRVLFLCFCYPFLGFVDNDGPYVVFGVCFNFLFCTFYFFLHVGLLVYLFW